MQQLQHGGQLGGVPAAAEQRARERAGDLGELSNAGRLAQRVEQEPV